MTYIIGECPECRRVIAAAAVSQKSHGQADIDEFRAAGLLVYLRDSDDTDVTVHSHVWGCTRQKAQRRSCNEVRN